MSNDCKYGIFGSSGYVGGNFCSRLYQKDNTYENIQRDCLKSKSREIVYFISTNNNYNIFSDPHLDINTNLNHLISVLEENRSTCKVFNFISSWFVYGNTDLPARADSNCYPTGFYSITKKCAEDLLISYCKTFDIDYRVIRMCNVYGRVDKKASEKKNALHFLVKRLIENKDIKLYNGGDVLRDYMHVDDVCEALSVVVETGEKNKIYNIGSGHPSRISDIISYAKSFLKSDSKISSIEIPKFHQIVQVKDMYLDVRDLTSLGFKQKISIESGIKSLCTELKENSKI